MMHVGWALARDGWDYANYDFFVAGGQWVTTRHVKQPNGAWHYEVCDAPVEVVSVCGQHPAGITVTWRYLNKEVTPYTLEECLSWVSEPDTPQPKLL